MRASDSAERNGGSAADAQHLAGEIVGRFYYDRAPAAAIPLGADIATMTSIANDYGFERAFERSGVATIGILVKSPVNNCTTLEVRDMVA